MLTPPPECITTTPNGMSLRWPPSWPRSIPPPRAPSQGRPQGHHVQKQALTLRTFMPIHGSRPQIHTQVQAHATPGPHHTIVATRSIQPPPPSAPRAKCCPPTSSSAAPPAPAARRRGAGTGREPRRPPGQTGCRPRRGVAAGAGTEGGVGEVSACESCGEHWGRKGGMRAGGPCVHACSCPRPTPRNCDHKTTALPFDDKTTAPPCEYKTTALPCEYKTTALPTCMNSVATQGSTINCREQHMPRTQQHENKEVNTKSTPV